MTMRVPPIARLFCTALVAWGRLASAEDDADQRTFFETKIRPLLVDKCQSCHSVDDPESKFNAESLEGLLRGGIRGPAIVRGKPAESLLISAVKHGEVLKMPPKEKLPASEIANLVKWIETGAYWPDAKPITIATTSPTYAEPEFSPEQRHFWAFQKPMRPAIPDAVRRGDFRSPIDRFVDLKLADAGYTPAAPATKRVLLRRATFDLIGLPPTPEEIDDFLADDVAGRIRPARRPAAGVAALWREAGAGIGSTSPATATPTGWTRISPSPMRIGIAITSSRRSTRISR